MRVSRDDIEVKLQAPGAVLRQRTGMGSVAGDAAISAEYFSLSAGVDTTPLFEGLDGNACQCPHWGYVIRGELTTTDSAGKHETVRANDLFFWPSGHNVRVTADAEIVMFSPQAAHTRVIDHMRRKLEGGPGR